MTLTTFFDILGPTEKVATQRVYKLESPFLWLSSSFVCTYMGKINLELVRTR